MTVDEPISIQQGGNVRSPADTLEPSESPPVPSYSESGEREHSPGSRRDLPFACNVCRKSYSRVGHLARHHRSHTLEKPFSCRTCGKGFSRADVLKRHTENHVNPDAAAKRQRREPYSRHSRAAKACMACASSKLKCEDEKPCQRCLRRGLECRVISGPGSFSSPVISTEDMQELGALTSLGEDSAAIVNELGQGMVDQPINFTAEIENGYAPSASLNGPSEQQYTGPLSESRLEHESSEVPSLTGLQMHNNDMLSRGSVQSTLQVQDAQSSSLNDSVDPLESFLNDILLSGPALDPFSSADLAVETISTSRDYLNFGMDWLEADGFGALSPIGIENSDAIQSIVDGGPLQKRQNQNQNHQVHPTSGTRTPVAAADAVEIGVCADAFRKSVWRWIPAQSDHQGADQVNLSWDCDDLETPQSLSEGVAHISQQHIDSAGRDSILAMVLSTCEGKMVRNIVSAFPNVELLDNLMHYYLRRHFHQISSWLHFPTFKVKTETPELLVMLIATGAAICPEPALQKLGFALQEAVSIALPIAFERDNRTTRSLEHLQAFALQLEVGLWSGNKRRMELSESATLHLITMLRRAGSFQRRTLHSSSIPAQADNQEILEIKWRKWVHLESLKRLTFHTMIHDAESSMALQTPPLIASTELLLDPPACQQLWQAGTSSEWRDIYIQVHLSASTIPQQMSRPLSSFVVDINPLRGFKSNDLPFSVLIVLCTCWQLVWNHLQLSSVLESQHLSPPNTVAGLYTNAPHHELRQALERIRLHLSEWKDQLRHQHLKLQVILDRILLNLHLPFDLVQNFAGKEGEEEARRAYPALGLWARSRQAREAIRYAGQVLKAVRSFENHHVSVLHFEHICVYHASLALWTWSVVSCVDSSSPSSMMAKQLNLSDLVWLDSDDHATVERWIYLGLGCPVVSDYSGGDGSLLEDRSRPFVSLTHPESVINNCTVLLQTQILHNSNNGGLPLVDNLRQLMRELGRATRGLEKSKMAR